MQAAAATVLVGLGLLGSSDGLSLSRIAAERHLPAFVSVASRGPGQLGAGLGRHWDAGRAGLGRGLQRRGGRDGGGGDCCGASMMAKKDFDKKYDSYDDFRTSGSMPNIPGIAEQYQATKSFVQESKGGVDEGDQAFGQRLTEAQELLKKEQELGLEGYEELKKDLISDTAYCGLLLMAAFQAFGTDVVSTSYGLGAAGSFAYAFLLTRSADRMGAQPGTQQGGFDPAGPLRFAILIFLIICCAKNRESLNVIPVLFGLFVPYKLASLKPVFVSLPPVKSREVRVYRDMFGGKDAPIYKVEYGSAVLGEKRKTASSSSPMPEKIYGSSAPLGKRNIPTQEELYEGIKKGTIS